MELEILKWVLGIVQLLVIAWCTHIYSELRQSRRDNNNLEKDLAAFKLHTSETYMTKTELTRAFDAINRSIEALGASMEARFERLDQKLDRKADR